MDESNISDLEGAKPSRSDAKVLLLGDFDPEGERIIKDPYYVILNNKKRFFSVITLQFYSFVLGFWFGRF